ncbi:MAG: BatA domain-containing protein [Planctomycetes bacterium]|nr:BatA domain-containing protein [Planctomycetota bacterium]
MPTWLIWTLGLGVPLAAAAVPVVIHLINLTRYRRVEWAAMEFLLNAYRRTRKRMQLESIIMLLLRVAAVILLAAALFPMGCERIKDWAQDSAGLGRLSLSTDAPLHLVLVFDDSASMAYANEGQTSFERGRQYALTLVESMRPGRDRVSIVRLSDVYVPPRAGGVRTTEAEAAKSTQRRVSQLASLDLDSARDNLAATTVAAVDTNVLGALREAARAIEGTPEQDAVGLVVISDFLESGWRELRKDGSVHKDFREVMDRITGRLQKAGTTAVFYDAGFDGTQNVAISRLECTDRIIGNGMEAKVLVGVDLFASGIKLEPKTVRLKYRIDGGSERPFSGAITLTPNRSGDPVELRLSPRDLALKPDEEKTGASRNIEVFTDEADALKADNSRSLVIHIVPDIPILVVNGVPHPNPSLDETFYLETALGISSSRSESSRGGETETRITPNRIISMRPESLTSVESFLDYRLVILCNVATLSEATIGKLEEFVAAGFGLLVFDGDQVDFQRWNQDLYKKGAGLLPVKLREPGGSSDPAAQGFGLVNRSATHPVVRLFSDRAEDLEILTGPKAVRNWRNVDLPTGAEADPLRPAEVLVGLNTTEAAPFLVERVFGRGRVMYCATTAGERWNDLWRSNGLPLFLYLELAHYLTSNEARFSNLAVGEPWRRALRASDVAPRFMVRDPAGTQGELLPTSEQGLKLLEYGGTAIPGVYTVTALDRTDSGDTRRKWQERFAVNLEARESNVVRLAGEDNKDVEAVVREALDGIPLNFQRAGTELGEGALAGADTGGGLWVWLAAFGVAFLMMETLWSAVITKPED